MPHVCATSGRAPPLFLFTKCLHLCKMNSSISIRCLKCKGYNLSLTNLHWIAGISRKCVTEFSYPPQICSRFQFCLFCGTGQNLPSNAFAVRNSSIVEKKVKRFERKAFVEAGLRGTLPSIFAEDHSPTKCVRASGFLTHLLDPEECCKISLSLQKSASVQPRTTPPKCFTSAAQPTHNCDVWSPSLLWMRMRE